MLFPVPMVTSPDRHIYIIRKRAMQNKSPFIALLFCIALDLHYLCTQNKSNYIKIWKNRNNFFTR